MWKLMLVATLVWAGCDGISSENIVRWKATQKGPGKLENALKDPAVTPKLRAESAAALVDIGMADEVDIAMAGIPADQRWEIVKTLVSIYTADMQHPDYPKARAARDGLFGIRGYAQPEEQKQIDTALLPFIEKEVREGRVAGGRHSLEKIFEALGPSASPTLVRLLEDDRVPYPGVADLLLKTGDASAREQAGAALVKRASAKQELIPALWLAMGKLGGPAVFGFLSGKVSDGSESEAVAAAQALAQRPDPAVLPLALRIAADPAAKAAVRDEMFGLLEAIGGADAREGLISIIGRDPNPLVRYRAFEAALAVGKEQAAVPALEAFSAQATYKREDVVDFLASDLAKLGENGRIALGKALASRSPVARMAAVLAFEAPSSATPAKTFGAAADADTLLKLAEDRGTVKGFPAGTTVGAEAVRVARRLKEAGSTTR